MDTKELFKKNLHTRRQELEENGWSKGEIKYQFDDLGFRKQLKNNFEKDILFLGCSVTFGLGINYEDSFTNVVADALGMNNVNWSIPGSSNDTAFRLCRQYLQKETPSMVILTSPAPWRFELFSDTAEGSLSHNITPQHREGDPFLHNNMECPLEFFDERLCLLNREKNILAMEMLCSKNKIKFLCMDVMEVDYVYKDFGRDLAHPGVRTNQLFADMILKKLV
jgi:hypothetical protein